MVGSRGIGGGGVFESFRKFSRLLLRGTATPRKGEKRIEFRVVSMTYCTYFKYTRLLRRGRKTCAYGVIAKVSVKPFSLPGAGAPVVRTVRLRFYARNSKGEGTIL